MHLLLTFLMVFAYDFFIKASIGKNTRVATIISFLCSRRIDLSNDMLWKLDEYRAFNIHIGAMFGTMMAFNVWFRIWPAQQKIITAIKNGEAPDAR